MLNISVIVIEAPEKLIETEVRLSDFWPIAEMKF